MGFKGSVAVRVLSVFVPLILAKDIDEKISLKKFVTSEERIKSHGYAAESHFIETTDGYVLNVFRIPYSHKLNNKYEEKPVILLQHGLISNSDCWLSSGPDNSLAYLLADAGYDVWLGNARGNIYSRRNAKMSLYHPRFWHFDWHEIGEIDLAAMIDYILGFTGKSALHYAGHSQGTTAYFVLMSQKPAYNLKIKSAHMLAPCAFFGHSTAKVFKLMVPLVGSPGGIWNMLLEDMELIPQNKFINRMIDTTCGPNPKIGSLCRNMYLWVLSGGGYQNTNSSSLQILLETHPAGASSNQGIHYIQLQKSFKFRQFDYGVQKNRKIYQQDTPPDYDLSQITAPTYLYSSANDILCVPKDVDRLVESMTVAEDYRIPEPTWNHLDFIVAKQMKSVLNDRILNNCNKHA